MSRPLHARWILPFVVLFAGFALWQQSRTLHWRTLAPGIEYASLRGEPYCRQGSSAIAVLRLDPRRARLSVWHYSRLHHLKPPSIVEWQQYTRALAVFNAGQFYPDWGYMGLLVSGGDTVSARPHPGFQAMFVAEPDSGAPEAHVLDLAHEPQALKVRTWREVAQSFMLFDSAGVRVRRSTLVARRTALGEDAQGRLVVCVSEGGYTLADFGELLMREPLRLTRAMSMDGGLEAELVISRDDFRYASFGDWPRTTEPSDPSATVPLPAVITVDPR